VVTSALAGHGVSRLAPAVPVPVFPALACRRVSAGLTCVIGIPGRSANASHDAAGHPGRNRWLARRGRAHHPEQLREQPLQLRVVH